MSSLFNRQFLCGLTICLLLTPAAAWAQAPNDQFYDISWHHPQIGSEAAWSISGGSRSVVVAVLDTGVDATHPDLAGHIVSGWNFNLNNDNTAPIASHGTAVAGVIAATRNNSIGVAGVADVSIMPIIVSEGSGMSDLDAATGIRWAVDHGAKVINISAGLLQGPRLREAAQYAWERNSLVVVATPNDNGAGVPSAWPEVITVGPSGRDGARLEDAPVGSFLDILAPGEDIATTFWSPTTQGYALGQGASFAAPMVSAAAALAWSINPELTSLQVRDMIYASAHDLGTPGYDLETGWGRLDVGALASAAAASVPEPSFLLGIFSAASLLLSRHRAR